MFVSGWTNGGVAIGCADVAVGGGRGRRLPHCLRSATLGVGPSRARFPVAGGSHVTTYGGPRAALRGSGRVWLSQTASPLSHLRHPCAGLPSLALREVLFRMATYPPLAQKRRERVPSQPCSLTAPAQAGTCCAWCGIWSHKDGPKRHTHRSDPGYPHFGPSRGAQKKSPKLSRLGELLNTQKNVHFLAPRAPRGPRGPKVHPGGYPPGPPISYCT